MRRQFSTGADRDAVAMTKRVPPPLVGQLKSGKWAVFNLPKTPLWDKTFDTQVEAKAALAEWYCGQKIREETP